MHELIGKGFAEERRRLGLTQEEAAQRLRGRGLTAWRTSTVGSLEAGLRRPRLDEVLLMAAALNVTVDRLIPGGDDERVNLGDGATVSPRWIREMLTGEYYSGKQRTLQRTPYGRFPLHEVMEQVSERAHAEREHYQKLTAPIREYVESDDGPVTDIDEYDIFATPTDAERHAARRLGLDVPVLKYSARVLWDNRDFDEERDRRVGNADELAPRSRQARRGLVTREMLAELSAFLDKVGVGKKRDG